MKEERSTKQLKKIQAQQEQSLRIGEKIHAHWSYSDYLENPKYFSAPVTVTENARDHIKASLNEDMKDGHGIILYHEGFVIWIPKTNNPEWSNNSRFYKNKFLITNKKRIL